MMYVCIGYKHHKQVRIRYERRVYMYMYCILCGVTCIQLYMYTCVLAMSIVCTCVLDTVNAHLVTMMISPAKNRQAVPVEARR